MPKASDDFYRRFREAALHEYLDYPVPMVALKQDYPVLHHPARGEELLHFAPYRLQVLLVHLETFDDGGGLPESSHLHPDLDPRLFAVEFRDYVFETFFLVTATHL